jgi:hypothetical protein
MGFEPMNTGFADRRVSHFAIAAHPESKIKTHPAIGPRVGLEFAASSYRNSLIPTRRPQSSNSSA